MLVAISKKAINCLLIKKRAELKRQWADDGKLLRGLSGRVWLCTKAFATSNTLFFDNKTGSSTIQL